MSEIFGDKVNLSFEIIDEYFKKNGIELDTGVSFYTGKLNGVPVHVHYDFNKILISFDNTSDIEAFFFYEDTSDRLLSHYFISRPKSNVLEISNSNIVKENEKYICTSTAGTWEHSVEKYIEKYGLPEDARIETTFKGLSPNDIWGKDLFELDGTLSSMPGIVNTSLIGNRDITSDELFSLSYMLGYEELLGTRFSKVRKGEASVR